MNNQENLGSAESKIKEVAERIARLRDDLGFSVEKMAELTDYSVEEYKQFETVCDSEVIEVASKLMDEFDEAFKELAK